MLQPTSCVIADLSLSDVVSRIKKLEPLEIVLSLVVLGIIFAIAGFCELVGER